jgi:hypothetical protein
MMSNKCRSVNPAGTWRLRWVRMMRTPRRPWWPTPRAVPAVSIPAAQVDAETQCLIAHGFKLEAIIAPGESGAPPAYQLSTDGLTPAEASTVASECAQYAPSPRILSDAEVRAVYDRWVKERECLMPLLPAFRGLPAQRAAHDAPGPLRPGGVGLRGERRAWDHARQHVARPPRPRLLAVPDARHLRVGDPGARPGARVQAVRGRDQR